MPGLVNGSPGSNMCEVSNSELNIIDPFNYQIETKSDANATDEHLEEMSYYGLEL